MLNIIIGLVCVVGGLSGKLALRGFNSPQALVGVGALLIAWGVWQMVRNRKQPEE